MELDLLAKVTDTYERKARVYPALLALIPPFGVAVGLYGIALEIEKGLLGLVASFGIIYLLASITRGFGKRSEDFLFKSWNGKPTTQLLRHSDETIDPVTKGRYHDFLSRNIGVDFPSATKEKDDPSAADDIYASGVVWLFEQTRDRKKFDQVFTENIAYGFQRNCYGIRMFASAIAWYSILFVLIANFITNGLHWKALLSFSNGALVSLLVSAISMFGWMLLPSASNVRTAAFTCAETLLRACDVLSQKPAPKKTHSKSPPSVQTKLDN